MKTNIIRYGSYTFDQSTQMLEQCYINADGETSFRHAHLHNDAAESLVFTFELLEKYEATHRAKRAIINLFANAFAFHEI